MFTQITPIVKRLLIIHAALLLLSGLVSFNIENLLALHYVGSKFFFPTQFFTYMFMHAGMWHLVGNMIGLIVFGNMLERFWGSRRFLFFYVVAGVGSGLLYSGVQFYQMKRMESRISAYVASPSPQEFNSFLLDYAPRARLHLMDFIDEYDEEPQGEVYISHSKKFLRQVYEKQANVPMVGASGAIFGILMAFGMLFPNTELFLLFPPMPIKAKYLVIFYGAYELWAELRSVPGDKVAHLAHLGGLLVGFIMVKYWQKNSKRFY